MVGGRRIFFFPDCFTFEATERKCFGNKGCDILGKIGEDCQLFETVFSLRKAITLH